MNYCWVKSTGEKTLEEVREGTKQSLFSGAQHPADR